MDSVFLGMAALACPISMGLMMWFMAKGMRKDKAVPNVEALRDEHRRLGQQIEQLEGDRAPAAVRH